MIVDVVVPTLGRPSLVTLLAALAAADGPLPGEIILVDDRRTAVTPLLRDGAPARLASRVRVLRGGLEALALLPVLHGARHQLRPDVRRHDLARLGQQFGRAHALVQ